MASLYAPVITNEELLSQKNLRHKKINFDYEYISGFLPYESLNPLKNINWTTIDFTKQNVAGLNNAQGIYMFTFCPYSFSMLNHSADIVLYVGQADNLKTRLKKYFYYPNSTKASDQEKRFMILYYSEYLKLHFYQTPNLNQADLDTLEYGLIDTLLPPYNLKVHSEFAQSYRRILN